MDDPKRFEGLKKFPADPAAAILARSRVKLRARAAVDLEVPVPQVLAALEAAGEGLEMLRLIAHALPPREATWWACLAARDMLAPGAAEVPPPLAAAEAWVFKPGDETRRTARAAMENADIDDDTVFCAMAATFADGTLGPDQLADYEAPRGGLGNAVHGMVLKSIFADAANADARTQLQIARGLDIARGGSGRIEAGQAVAGAAPRKGA